MPARWRLVTARSPGGSAAIGAFLVSGDVDGATARLGMEPVEVGAVRLRSFGGIDRGVAARPARDALLLMPHAGPAVLGRMETWLAASGLARDELDPRALYPEAGTLLEARMLHALARAQSPLAIDLLLDQPRRWGAAGEEAERDPEVLRRSVLLNRLIDPPTVAALGPANIGKSTLLNTLSGRSVSIVADEAGTTRDHVGVRLDLAGLVVNYIDAPGIGAGGGDDAIQREAQELAFAAAGAADVVLLCADATAGFVAPPRGPAVLRVGLRSDLGRVPGAEVEVSARTGRGMDELVGRVREMLVPRAVMEDPGPWRFW